MKIEPTYLLTVCIACLGLPGVVRAQHSPPKTVKRHAIARSHRGHRGQRMTTLTLTPIHGKGVYHLRVSAALAKKIAKSKDKRLDVVP